MTFPPPSAALPPAALVGPGVTSTSAGPSREGLGWLLEDFRNQVPGVTGAFLVARDGLVIAAAGLSTDEADNAAAVAASLYSIGGAAGQITSTPVGDVQQVIVEHDGQTLVLRSTPDQDPDAAAQAPEADSGVVGSGAVVGCVLGVLARPDAQTGLVSHGMTMLIESVARHMVTAARTAGGAGAPAPAPAGDGAGLQSEGCGDEQ